jgi:hypothetical protein
VHRRGAAASLGDPLRHRAWTVDARPARCRRSLAGDAAPQRTRLGAGPLRRRRLIQSHRTFWATARPGSRSGSPIARGARGPAPGPIASGSPALSTWGRRRSRGRSATPGPRRHRHPLARLSRCKTRHRLTMRSPFASSVAWGSSFVGSSVRPFRCRCGVKLLSCLCEVPAQLALVLTLAASRPGDGGRPAPPPRDGHDRDYATRPQS